MVLLTVTGLTFCIGLLFSFWGYGALSCRLLSAKEPRHPPFVIIGFTLFILMGGALVAFAMVSAFHLWALYGVGCLLALGLGFRGENSPVQTFFTATKKQIHERPFGVVALLGAAFFWAYESSLLLQTSFNPHDDFYAYLVFPQKLLSLGSFGFDPYNYRLLTSAQGAHSFFLAMGLAFAGFDFLYFLEATVGMGLLVSVIVWQTRVVRAPTWVFVLGFFLALLLMSYRTNLSSVETSTPVLFALMVLGFYREQAISSRALRLVAFGTLGGVAIALKTTNLPLVFIILALSCLHQRHAQNWLVDHLVILSIVACGVLLWGVAHYGASGSLLYPFLGKGHACFGAESHLTSYEMGFDAALITVMQSLMRSPLLQTLVILCWVTTRVTRSEKQKRFCIALGALSIAAGFVILGQMGFPMDGKGGHIRYAAPLWKSGILFVFILYCQTDWKSKWQASPGLYKGLGLGLLGVLVFQLFTVRTELFKVVNTYQTYRQTMGNYFSPTAGQAQMQKMQNAIPAGEKVFVRLSKPHLLDFQRNVIFVSDFPNMSGPDNCFEAEAGPEIIQKYFLSQGIRYIAYSFINEAGFQKEFFQKHQSVKNRGWQESTRRVYAFQNELEKMMTQYEHTYKDQAFVVLDLARPLPQAPSPTISPKDTHQNAPQSP